MKFHPIANVFPLLPDSELQELADDIRELGLKEPIWTYEEKILDGRNRSAACVIAGVDPKFREFKGTRLDALDHVWSLNRRRRHLNSSQAAMSEDKREKLSEEYAAEIEKLKAKQPKGGRPPKLSKPVQQIGQVSKRDRSKNTDESRAKSAGTNRQYLRDIKKIRAENPEYEAKIEFGEMTIPQVKRKIKEKNREKRRERNRRKVAAAKGKLPKDIRFATIAIDPPWDWRDEGDNNQLGRARPDYASMTIDQISNLPVANLADEDCHLYLWITNRSLPKGFALIEKWGFRYVACLTWCKPSFGMGNYFRGSTEQILFAVKGSQPLKRKDAGTWFQWPRGEEGHSSKPLEFYDLVESCSPGPFLEMFSRTSRKGWTAWGESS